MIEIICCLDPSRLPYLPWHESTVENHVLKAASDFLNIVVGLATDMSHKCHVFWRNFPGCGEIPHV